MTRWFIGMAIALAGCGFTIDVVGGGDDGVPDGTRITLTDDTAADFADNDGLVDAVIAPRGVIEPDAFILGGLEAHGFAGNHVADASTYDSVIAATSAAGTELGFSYRQVPADWSMTTANRPRGLGITSTDNYTVLYTGEILLPQGTVTLETDADDRAIVQVALDGTTFGERLFAHNSTATIQIQVPAAGWYPIRAALGQGGGSAHWRLEITPLGSPKIRIDGKRLRARARAGGGLIASAFVGKGLLVASGETALSTINQDYGNGSPSHDMGLSSSDAFSMRFAGQVRIETAGAYTFSADVGTEPLDLFRIWIDGTLVANYWPPTPDRRSATLTLSEGWHDLLVDYADEAQTAEVELRMSGPGVTEGPIDPQRLRPAVAFGLTASYVAFANFPLMDAGVVNIPLLITAPAGATIGAVDYGFGIGSQRLSDLTVGLLDCHGVTTLAPLAGGPYFYFAHDPSCAGMPVTPWAWRVADTVPGNDVGGTPVLYNPMLVVTYSGGDRMPFAPAFTFQSAAMPTPGAIGFAQPLITADLRGAMLMFEMRAAADPSQLAAASWVPVDSGTVPNATASEWVQYRFAVTSDGWKLASVDKVEITYVVPAE